MDIVYHIALFDSLERIAGSAAEDEAGRDSKRGSGLLGTVLQQEKKDAPDRKHDHRQRLGKRRDLLRKA